MPLTFHLLDATSEDIYDKPYANKDSGDHTRNEPSYVIHCFGKTADGTTVQLKVKDFKPFFYVELPPTRRAFSDFSKRFLSQLSRNEKTAGLDIQLKEVKKTPMYGYTGGTSIPLVELKMNSRRAFYAARNLVLNDRSQPIFQLYANADPLKVYDATLDPMLRFFHLCKIQPCGWITVEEDVEEDGETVLAETSWTSIKPCGKPPMASAPFKMCFWDIECYSASGDFPVAKKGDPVIQIGNVVVQQGMEPEKRIFVLGECSPVPGAIVEHFKTEKAMLQAWMSWFVECNPDLLVGYNIFGFDERYLWDRLAAHGYAMNDEDNTSAIEPLLNEFSRHGGMKLQTKFLSSSALGDNFLYMWNTVGRLQVDLYHYIRRSASLPSYKLDDVCQFYMSGKLSSVDTTNPGTWVLKTKQTGDVIPGRYVVLLDETGEALVEKMKVLSVEPGKSVTVEMDSDENMSEAVKWAVVKDDVPPQEIFRLHREGGAEGRGKVAAYCIQDCDLVYELYKKLDVFNNAMSMANVCSVPVSYIFTRGQGVKIESLIFKECYERNMVVEVQDTPSRNKDAETDGEDDDKEESYEGAIVLDPVPGFYSQSPIGVCDFASLYPSTIISEDISHDSLVWVKDFDLKGNLVAIPFGDPSLESVAPPGTRFTDIDFDIWRPDPNDKRKHPEKLKAGIRVCRYAQKPDGSKHTLPDIVAKLLAARKAKRKEAEKETDIFRKALLDAEQLAYKLTANSLYGQLGSSTFKIRLQHLAASTTAYGRKQILFAKAAIEKFYGPEANDPRCSATIVYGDTDSLFVDFGVKNPETGELLAGTEAVEATMHITEEAGKFITGALKPPHDFEYDKVFDQFIIFSKKRYVGNKYEESATDFKQTSMGIVLKRRDNAPILKTIYGGAIQILLNERDVPKAAKFVSDKCMEMVEGKSSLSQLTITKSLSAKYKPDYVKQDIKDLEEQVQKKAAQMESFERMPSRSDKDDAKMRALEANIQALYSRIAEKREDLTRFSYPAHKILADRMAARDAGNAPASGERLGFVYISAVAGQLAPKLQGDRIETPEYIRAKNLQPDYRYYIEHQLMKPIGQLFGLMVEKIPGSPPNVTLDQADTIAIELLFGKALQACDKIAVRNFVSNQFGVTMNPVERRTSPRLAEKQELVTAPKIQTTINSYFLNKAIAAEYKAKKVAAEVTIKQKSMNK